MIHGSPNSEYTFELSGPLSDSVGTSRFPLSERAIMYFSVCLSVLVFYLAISEYTYIHTYAIYFYGYTCLLMVIARVDSVNTYRCNQYISASRTFEGAVLDNNWIEYTGRTLSKLLHPYASVGS